MNTLNQRIMQRLIHLPTHLWETAKRFSGTMVLLLVLYLLLDWEVYTDAGVDSFVFWILGLGAVALLAVDLILEAHPMAFWKGLALRLLTLGLLAAAYPTLDTYPLRPIFLLVAVVAFFGISVCLAYSTRIEETLGVLLVRGGTSLLFSGVLFVGAYLVLAGVDLLLFSINSETFGEVLRFSFLLFAPLMFLAGIPKQGEEKSLIRGYQQLLRLVVLPLLALFLLVLYGYYGKLLFTSSLPISELGGVSLAYLGICLPVIILAKPFLEGGFARLRQVLLFGTLPVLAILFWADIRQILLYGVSITRYIVLLGGIALLLCVVLLILKKKYLLPVFGVLLTAVLVCSYGPQNCYNLTRRSQHDRLTDLVASAGSLENGVFSPLNHATIEQQREVWELIQYCNRNQLDLPHILPQFTDENMSTVLGIDREKLWEKETGDNSWYHYPEGTPISLGGGQYYLSRSGTFTLLGKAGEWTIESSENVLIRLNGEVVHEILYEDILKSVYAAVTASNTPESYLYTFDLGDLRGVIPLDYVSRPEPELYGNFDGIFITVTEE